MSFRVVLEWMHNMEAQTYTRTEGSSVPLMAAWHLRWKEEDMILVGWLIEKMQVGMVWVGLQMLQQRCVCMCVCVIAAAQRWLTVSRSCCTVAFPVTRCQTGSRTETRAEAWAPPPRSDPVQVLTPGPGPPVGQRRGNEQTPSRWGNALLAGYMERELVWNLQKAQRHICSNMFLLILQTVAWGR